MSLRSKTCWGALAALALTIPAAHAADKDADRGKDAPTSDRACFLSKDWQGWSAPGNGDFILLRVRNHEIWRVDLTKGTHVHKYGDEFLVNKLRGSAWICGPLDLDLSLSDHQGFRQPLIARGLRRLTPAEVAAIPKKDLPG